MAGFCHLGLAGACFPKDFGWITTEILEEQRREARRPVERALLSKRVSVLIGFGTVSNKIPMPADDKNIKAYAGNAKTSYIAQPPPKLA